MRFPLILMGSLSLWWAALRKNGFQMWHRRERHLFGADIYSPRMSKVLWESISENAAKINKDGSRCDGGFLSSLMHFFSFFCAFVFLNFPSCTPLPQRWSWRSLSCRRNTRTTSRSCWKTQISEWPKWKLNIVPGRRQPWVLERGSRWRKFTLYQQTVGTELS